MAFEPTNQRTPPTWLGRMLLLAAWAWILLVITVTFWNAWEIPARMPEINDVATVHAFLFPISLLLFLSLSWARQRQDNPETGWGRRSFPRWRATMALWLLVLVHPASCGLYPAMYNLDDETVAEISGAVKAMPVGISRGDVEKRILELNGSLPVSMKANAETHRMRQAEVADYLAGDPVVRHRLWPSVSRAMFVFIPWGEKGEEPNPESPQVFIRRMRPTSDIGVDRLTIRYGPSSRMEEITYSSNRQLTEERSTCTVHLVVPAPPEASFPYPCPK